MTPIEIALVLFLAPLAWACFSSAREERRHRAEWQAMPVPRTEIGDPPYRAVSIAVGPAGRAPLLVRLAAVGCLWIGQGLFVLMLIATFFLRRSARTVTFFGGQGTEHGSVGWADMVFRLGPLLLRRDRAVNAVGTVAATLLRYWAGVLMLPLLALLGGMKAAPVFWWSLVCFGALSGLLSAVLSLVMRRCVALFPPVDTCP